MTRDIRPPAYVVALGVMYGLTICFAKIASASGIPALALAFWQMLIGGTVLLGVAMARGASPRLDWRNLRYYFAAGLLGNAVPFSLSYLCAAEIGAALTGLVYPLSPIFTFTLAVLFRTERASARRLLGLIVGLSGVGLVLAPSLAGADANAGWALVALSIPVVLAFGNIYRTWDWPPGAESLSLAAGMLLASAVLLVGPMMVMHGFYLPTGASDWPLIANGSISVAAFVLYFELQRIAGPVYFSQISYPITLTTTVFGVAVFGESLASLFWLALGLVFLGLALTTRAAKPVTD